MKQSWSIVIFTYNEEGNIGGVIDACRSLLTEIASEWEVIVVDDGSTDGSVKEIKQRLSDTIRLIRHSKNKGIGQTLRDGYAEAKHENICAVPGDGEFDVNELKKHPVLGAEEFVSYYRRVRTTYSSYRDLLSHVNRYLNKLLIGLNLRDVNWIKVYKKQQLDQLDLRLTSSLVESEICAKLSKKGLRVIQEPSTYHERKSGKSKGSSFKIVWQAMNDVLKLIYTVHFA